MARSKFAMEAVAIVTVSKLLMYQIVWRRLSVKTFFIKKIMYRKIVFKAISTFINK